jgi:hypothetical protein
MRLNALSTNPQGTLMALSSHKALAQVFLVQTVKDIVIKAAELIDSSTYDQDENHTYIHIKMHIILLENYFWHGSLG